MVFTHVVIGQPAGVAVRHVLNPDPVERRERELTTVGRDHRVADLPRRNRRRCIDLVGELDLRPDIQVNVHLEWDVRGCATIHRHTPYLTAVGHHDRS